MSHGAHDQAVALDQSGMRQSQATEAIGSQAVNTCLIKDKIRTELG